MFKFLKEKLKATVSKFSKKVEEAEVKETIEEEPKEEKKQEEVEKEPEKEEVKEEKPKKKILKKIKERISTRRISEQRFENLFNDLEIVLLQNNVAVEVIDKIKESLKVDLVNIGVKGKVSNAINTSLKESIEGVLEETNFDLVKEVENKKEKPYVIVFVGVNGSGKTTTIAKIANLLLKNNLKCVLVAADTFRAASIQQLEEHARKLNVKVIKHDYGADPAAVTFDGVKHAKARNIDVVLVDTAGRQHKNINLIDEMKKIVRIANPDLKLFVGEAITGNDCINQAREFDKAISIDGIILTKQDVDEKGGTAISISFVSSKPIVYIGNGQKLGNLERFNKDDIIKNIGL